MRTHRYHSKNPTETMRLATRLARRLKKKHAICLYGELGSGKTVFTKGIARGLNIDHHHVNSPTFVLLNTYKGRMPLFHFDLYRVSAPHEVIDIGYEEYVNTDGIVVVEWAERLGPLVPANRIDVLFSTLQEDKRHITISAHGEYAETAIRALEK